MERKNGINILNIQLDISWYKMPNIRFFYKPEKPLEYNELLVKVSGNDFSDMLTFGDRAVIENNWKKLREEKGDKVFSRPGGLGSLVDTKNNIFTYRPTEFKVYVAVTLTYQDKLLNNLVYDNMRVSAVGAVLKLADEKVFVHRRSINVTHAKSMVDSSVAGLVHFDYSIGNLNFQKSLFEKLHRELKIKDEEVKNVAFTGVHSSYDPDFSGMADFAVETVLESGDIEERIDKNYFGEHYFIPVNKLADFVFNYYAVKRDMIGDGCAAILASLDHNLFFEAVRKINEHLDGKVIQFGRLDNGLYIRKDVD